MKKFTKKGILQKTIIVILMVLSFNFIVPAYSSASVGSVVGGVLINPLLSLGTAVGDTVETLLQWTMTGKAESETSGIASAVASIFETKIMVDYDEAENYDAKYDGGDPASIEVSVDQIDTSFFSLTDKYKIPVVDYTPIKIFNNDVPYLDINFITPKWDSTNSEYAIKGSAKLLQNTISGWYVALRNLSIVGLLCVLVYVGIRIILSSTSADKAKYKQMFTDWIIALCILFFLHYIMSFTLVMVDAVNDAIGKNGEATSDTVIISVDGAKYQTNFMGAARFMAQAKDTIVRFAYTIIYIMLVGYTAIFTWHYLKRLLMMAFLTIIAPLVALTYPIDKMGDGKAQAFSMWLKEYVYNALIQPFHLIIYMIFVGSAMELAQVNAIYAIAAIAFILPAEKILKKMFGFDRAPLGTMGALTGFTAGTLASKLGKGKSSGGKGGAGESGSGSAEKQPRFQKTHGIDGIDGAPDGYGGAGEDNKEDAPKTRFDGNGGNDGPIDAEPQGLPGPGPQDLPGPTENDQTDVDYKEMPLDDEEEAPQRFSDEDVEKFAPDGTKIDNSTNSSSEDANTTKHSKVSFGQKVRNVTSAYGGAGNIAKRTIKGVAKTATRVAFTGAGMTVGMAAGLTSGKGLTGALAGITAGKAVGQRLGNSAINTAENAARFAGNVKENGRRILDMANQTTEREDEARAKAFMKDEKVDQYIRDKMTAANNGMTPTSKEVKQEKESMRDYVDEGLTDVAEIYRAKKAEKYVDSKQAAKIARLAKERKITSKELGDEKQYKGKMQDLTQEFMDKRGMDEKTARNTAEHTLNVMKAQVGQQHNLKPKTDSGAASKATTGTSSGKKK